MAKAFPVKAIINVLCLFSLDEKNYAHARLGASFSNPMVRPGKPSGATGWNIPPAGEGLRACGGDGYGEDFLYL